MTFFLKDTRPAGGVLDFSFESQRAQDRREESRDLTPTPCDPGPRHASQFGSATGIKHSHTYFLKYEISHDSGLRRDDVADSPSGKNNDIYIINFEEKRHFPKSNDKKHQTSAIFSEIVTNFLLSGSWKGEIRKLSLNARACIWEEGYGPRLSLIHI